MSSDVSEKSDCGPESLFSDIGLEEIPELRSVLSETSGYLWIHQHCIEWTLESRVAEHFRKFSLEQFVQFVSAAWREVSTV